MVWRNGLKRTETTRNGLGAETKMKFPLVGGWGVLEPSPQGVSRQRGQAAV